MKKILFIGDIFGEPGRAIVKKKLPVLKDQHQIDFVIANCENAAHGKGVSVKIANELLASSVDFLTSGNHIWQSKDILPYLDNPDNHLIRPANFPNSAPGRGYAIVKMGDLQLAIINLMGRSFMPLQVGSPFETFDHIYQDIQEKADLIFIDMHAETTSEKRAMGWYVDGRAHICAGTHTHVQTADEEVLPNGCAYITDVGMTGPYDSVIGLKKEIALQKMLTSMPQKFEVAKNDVRLCAVVIEIDESLKKAVGIQRICEKLD